MPKSQSHIMVLMRIVLLDPGQYLSTLFANGKVRFDLPLPFQFTLDIINACLKILLS